MTTMDDTQTIDANALRARLAEMAQRARDEMAPAGLRERIETALRARHGADASVDLGPAPDGFSGRDAVAFVTGGYAAARGNDEDAALRGLARIVGLNADGTDPRDQGEALARRLHAERESVVAELDRARDETDALRALLEVAQTSLAAATSGRRVTVVDEIERLQRERDAAQWSAMATRQDIEQLARVVGRTSIELVLERVVDGRTVTQTPSAHVLADGRAYAPILGASVPAAASLRDLIGAVEKSFGDGFKCTSTRPIGGGR